MKKHLPFLCWSGLLLASPSALHAGCCERHEPAETFRQADAIGEYRIVGKESVALGNGRIVTRFTASLNAALKGDAPADLSFETPGGQLPHKVEISSLQLDLAEGDDSIFHLRKNADGSWSPVPFRTIRNAGTPAARKAVRDFIRQGARGRFPQGATAPATFQEHSGIPGSVVTTTGYLENSSGHPGRHATCDSGMEIPYLVDIDVTKLPPGMDQAGALAAVEEVLGVWESVSSLRFRFEGLQSFGVAATTLTPVDGRLRIQLHDTYNFVSLPALGVANGQMTAPPEGPPTVYCGGVIGSQGFQELLNANVVLEHDHAFMDDVENFKLVLTHEIGHAIGLAHSSNNPSEPNAILKNATMYFQASNDGRGAALTEYDEDRVALGYPVGNTPPYSANRTIRGVARSSFSSTFPPIAGVNRINLRATDLQGGTLTPSLSYASTFKLTLSGSQLVYAATDFLSQTRRSDTEIETASAHYGLAYVQFSDGVNLSRAARCTVIEVSLDSSPSDGLPNNWMDANFNDNTAGAAGSNRHPDSDPDKDGLTNRDEFLLNTNPNSAASGPVTPAYDHAARKLTFTPVRFAPYAIESSTNLAGPWTLRQVGANFSTSGTMITEFTGAAPTREFYRVATGP